jgi:hypothetical protein
VLNALKEQLTTHKLKNASSIANKMKLSCMVSVFVRKDLSMIDKVTAKKSYVEITVISMKNQIVAFVRTITC